MSKSPRAQAGGFLFRTAMLHNRFPESPPTSGERSAQNQVQNPASPLVFSVQPGKTASAPRVQPHWAAGFRRTNFLTGISAGLFLVDHS